MHVTPATFSNSRFIPVSMPQTELRRGKEISIASIALKKGESLEFRSITLHVVSVLTPGIDPEYHSKALGLCSVGVYAGSMRTGALALLKASSSGAVALNSFVSNKITTKGTYDIVVSNNTSNVDLSVLVTGSLLWKA